MAWLVRCILVGVVCTAHFASLHAPYGLIGWTMALPKEGHSLSHSQTVGFLEKLLRKGIGRGLAARQVGYRLSFVMFFWGHTKWAAMADALLVDPSLNMVEVEKALPDHLHVVFSALHMKSAMCSCTSI
ncbi:MAG: hypothetical protein WHS46_06035 [Desulfosoma sp.]